MKTTSKDIDEFLRRKKINEKVKIDIALLLELMHGFADEQIEVLIRIGNAKDKEIEELKATLNKLLIHNAEYHGDSVTREIIENALLK